MVSSVPRAVVTPSLVPFSPILGRKPAISEVGFSPYAPPRGTSLPCVVGSVEDARAGFQSLLVEMAASHGSSPSPRSQVKALEGGGDGSGGVA